MNEYVELSIDDIELDVNNPRIANFLEYHDKSEMNSEVMALLLGTSSEACASLKGSIRDNGGIVHPIIVNEYSQGKYIVIEGNTRLQIYRDFRKQGVPGKWDTIKSIVYMNMDNDTMHSIRLQAHLIGPREWDPYSKAKYLHYLAYEEYMPMSILISFCGGNSKASEIKNMIGAYRDMQEYYRPLCDDDTVFDPKKFHGFVELQRSRITEGLALHNYTKTDFSKWMLDDKFSTLQDVRRLPDILNSKKASQAFFKNDSRLAIKILAVEEVTPDQLKDVPYEMLARELEKRMNRIEHREVCHLRDDADYSSKMDALKDVYDAVKFVIGQVQGELTE